jgi:PAS domain S-box-containing protein/putative nucleotidyltransferase with HDIG domain
MRRVAVEDERPSSIGMTAPVMGRPQDSRGREHATASGQDAAVSAGAGRALSPCVPADEALHHDLDWLRAIIEASSHAIIAVDLRDVVSVWNAAAERLFGWTLKEVVGRPVPYVPVEKQDESGALTARVRAGEKFSGLETRRRRKDGSLVEVRLSGAPLHDRSGRPVGAVVVAEDITEQKKAKAELEAFYHLSGRLRTAHTPEEMYPIIVEHATRVLDAEGGRLSLLSSDGRSLMRVHVTGLTAPLLGVSYPVAGSLSGYVMATGEPYITNDYASDPRRAPHDVYRQIGSVVIVPVRSEEETMGTLAAHRLRGAGVAPFTPADARLLQGLAEIAGTAIRRARLYRNLEDAYMQMVLALARTVDVRDAYTAEHSERLAGWAVEVARVLGCGDEDLLTIRWGALLHDIGKIGVPDSILRKPVQLTETEWAVMRQHPAVGERILQSAERMRAVAQIVRSHQERWDGLGYPDGLRGEEIALGARIVAVVDAYSAMIDNRPYRSARSHEDAVAELRRCAGSEFDPRVVEAFCQVIGRGTTRSIA